MRFAGIVAFKQFFAALFLFFISACLWSSDRFPIVVNMNPHGSQENTSGHKKENDPHERYSQFTRNESEVDAIIHYLSLLRKREEEVPESKKESVREQSIRMSYRIQDIDKMLRNDPDLAAKYKEFFKERLTYNLKSHYVSDPRFKAFLADLNEINRGIKLRDNKAAEIFENEKMKKLKVMARSAGVTVDELSAQEFAQKYNLSAEQGITTADILKAATTFDEFSFQKEIFFKIPEIKKEFEQLYAEVDERFALVTNPYFVELAKAEAKSAQILKSKADAKTRTDAKLSSKDPKSSKIRRDPSLGSKKK